MTTTNKPLVLATPKSIKGEWIINFGDREVNYAKDAAKAMQAMADHNELYGAQQASELLKAQRPLIAKQGKASAANGGGTKPMLEVRYGGTGLGNYPAFAVYGNQFNAMVAGFPGVIEEFNMLASQGAIDATFTAGGPKAQPVSEAQIKALIAGLQALVAAPATV